MSFDLTNQYISQSFQQLTQISGSVLVNGTGSAIDNLTVTSSYATQALSASNAVTASFATQALSATSASFASTATSASHAVQADNATQADDLVITVKNVSGVTITKGTAVHATGVTGENVNVVTASADDSNLMPAIGVASADINDNGNGEVIIAGRLTGFSTTGLVAGSPVYVDNGGALTATKPTGSSLIQNIGTAAKINGTDGELIVQGAGRSNDIPNISPGYFWVGNNDSVATAVSTGSFLKGNDTGSLLSTASVSDATITFTKGDASTFDVTVNNVVTSNTASYVAGANVDGAVANATNASTASYVAAANVDGTVANATSASHAVNADTASFLPSSTRLNITDITASNASFTSASIGYLQTVTGSATIIGDEFIVVNADVPAARYAGMKIYDSGSNATASLEWDGVNDYFIQQELDGNTVGFVHGPSGSRGSETFPSNNTIIKGTGTPVILDSNLVDDGSKISSTLPFSSSAGFTGSLNGQADTAVSSSHAVNADTASTSLDSGNWDGQFTGSAGISGSLALDGGFTLTNGAFTTTQTGINNNTQRNFIDMPNFTKTLAPQSGSTYTLNDFGYLDYSAFGAVYGPYEQAYAIEQWNGFSYNVGMETLMGAGRAHMFVKASGTKSAVKREALIGVLSNTDSFDSETVVRCYGTSMEFGERTSYTINFGNAIHNVTTGEKTEFINFNSRYVNIGTAPGMNYTKIDGTTIYFDSSSGGTGGFPTQDIEAWYTGSFTFHQTGSSIDKPAVLISGSVQQTVGTINAASNTASLDARANSYFELNLTASADTHIQVTNISPGQTYILKTVQPATTGSVSFDSAIKFAGGTAPTGSSLGNAVDIYTFVSFDSSDVYATAVENLS